MWEIFSYGMIPYYGLSNIEVIEKVTIEGYRLPSPANCPKEIYQWMLDCWNDETVQRPSFQQLYDRIEAKWEEAIQNQVNKRIIPKVGRRKEKRNVDGEHDASSIPIYAV